MKMDVEKIFVCGVFVFVIVAVIAATFSSAHSEKTIADMVKAGAHPLDALCSVEPRSHKEMCTLRAVGSEAHQPTVEKL